VLATAASAGDIVDVIALNIGTFTSGGYTRTTYTGTAGQTSFTAAYTPNYVQVYLNGVLLDPTDYTATSGTAIVLGTGTAAGDTVDIVALNIGGFTGGVTVTGTPASGQLTSWTGSSSIQGFAPSAIGDVPFSTNGTTFAATQKIVRGTTVTLTTQTSVDFTNIPSWVKRITIMFNGISMSSATPYGIIQIGSGSVSTSGYLGTMVTAVAGTTVGAAFTNSFGFINLGAAADTENGIFVLTTLGSNVWVASGNFTTTSSSLRAIITAGNITLSGALDRVRITTTDGTSTLDAGTVNILYE
jgi:hypothetical protein